MRRRPPAKLPKPAPAPATPATASRTASAARLRAQTRKVLGKHYRAKYGVR